MKTFLFLLSAVLLASPTLTHAAIKEFPISSKITTIENGHKHSHKEKKRHAFRVEVISDRQGLKPEKIQNSKPYVIAKKDERYAIRVYNPLPIQVAVNLTVDGLNSITGKPSGISDGSKWIMKPNSYVTIRGWQVNKNELRRFFFTEKPKSYAEWRSQTEKVNLSDNCGVIGAAFFWDKKKLQRYYDNHPIVRWIPGTSSRLKSQGSRKAGNLSLQDERKRNRKEMPAAVEEQEAGTGMGERESHPTRLVNFHYNTGMYKLSQAIVIYYDFEKPYTPNPFPNLSYAPEMP